jgi:hypothetical protein
MLPSAENMIIVRKITAASKVELFAKKVTQGVVRSGEKNRVILLENVTAFDRKLYVVAA